MRIKFTNVNLFQSLEIQGFSFHNCPASEAVRRQAPGTAPGFTSLPSAV